MERSLGLYVLPVLMLMAFAFEMGAGTAYYMLRGRASSTECSGVSTPGEKSARAAQEGGEQK